MQARAARAHFATALNNVFSESKHCRLAEERPEAKKLDIDGFTRIGAFFNTVVRKHAVVRADERKTFDFSNTYDTKPVAGDLKDFCLIIYAFDGDKVPDWLYVRYGVSLSHRSVLLGLTATYR